MNESKSLPPHLTGGQFLLGETDFARVFTPEDLSSVQRLGQNSGMVQNGVTCIMQINGNQNFHDNHSPAVALSLRVTQPNGFVQCGLYRR